MRFYRLRNWIIKEADIKKDSECHYLLSPRTHDRNPQTLIGICCCVVWLE